MKTIEKEQIQANSLRNQRGPPLVAAGLGHANEDPGNY